MATVTGGAGRSPITLRYDSKSIGAVNAQALISAVTTDFSDTKAIYESASHPVNGSNDGGYLIVTKGVLDTESANAKPIVALGFDAVTIQNNGEEASVRAGGASSLNQTILAGDGGLYLTAATGNVSVAAGGGDNHIVFGSGADAFYSTEGANTVHAGSGSDTIQAGNGSNTIILGSGTANVTSSGSDRILLGTGNETISAVGRASDHIFGASSVASGTGYTLTFQGGSAGSTVLGGAGSYDIKGGAGGGSFTGGSAGGNLIIAGSGNVTITGGGAGDTLSGGTGNDAIRAGGGNETLSGGGGHNTFTFTDATMASQDVITDFQNYGDLVHFVSFGGVNEDKFAASHMTVQNGSTTVSLSDGTTINFLGVTNLNTHSFH